MYRYIRDGNVFRVVDPDGKVSKWSSYSQKEARWMAEQLVLARAYYFVEEV